MDSFTKKKIRRIVAVYCLTPGILGVSLLLTDYLPSNILFIFLYFNLGGWFVCMYVLSTLMPLRRAVKM